ncbi:MAG: hypothetical protein AB7G11_15645 [Phycisphaerales bacterium]
MSRRLQLSAAKPIPLFAVMTAFLTISAAPQTASAQWTATTGYGFNLITERTEALLWMRPVPGPSAVAVLGLGALVAARRRRSCAAGTHLDLARTGGQAASRMSTTSQNGGFS